MTYGPARINLDSQDLRTSDAAAWRENRVNYTRHGGGSVQASFQSSMRQSPTIDYTTADLRRLLDVCDAADAPSGAAAIVATWSKPGDNTIPYATAVSRAFAASAVHFINSFSFASGEVARAAVTAYALSANGTTDPTTKGNPTPPAHISDVEEWVVSSVVQGATQITKWSAIDITIEHGATTQADECFNGQLPFPLLCVSGGTRGGINVSCTIQGHDLATELAVTTPLVITLKPKQRNSASLGTDTITITLIPGQFDKDIADGSPSMASLTIACYDDGTNRPLTIALPA